MTKLAADYQGVWPVMLTPFDARGEIDWNSLERLIDWYIAAGVHGLFANCQSSEMFLLSDAESVRLTKFVVQYVALRVPVVASGHTAAAFSQQLDQLGAMAATGADAVILNSNRLATPSESDDRLLENLAWLVDRLGQASNLGVYECPYPCRRLLSEDAVRWCAQHGRFRFIKDTSCNIATIRRRAEIAKGTPLNIANANAQTLLASLYAGAAGYCGVMTNFHPKLYVWLYDNWRKEPEKAEALSDYLSTSALLEDLNYPLVAKDYQVGIGNFANAKCRSREADNYYRDYFQTNMQQTIRLGERLRRLLDIHPPSVVE